MLDDSEESGKNEVSPSILPLKNKHNNIFS